MKRWGGLGAIAWGWSLPLYGCPADLPQLSAQLSAELVPYLNRAYTQTRVDQLAIAISPGELAPLPTQASAAPPDQLFVSVLTHPRGQRELTQTAYWLFWARHHQRWYLSAVYTRTGEGPPWNVSDGIMGQATRRWLRDRCRPQPSQF
ncbi:MAG TPA: hypothetical protein DCQ32_05500 [Cyanobacteria bacterium UBA8156]|jgi:hypothetical protein|nr:hypothetical protein [Cyanobacteria bacterium UBA8156]